MTLFACSAAPEPKRQPWSAYIYPGFSEKINALSGGDSIDCGFDDWVNTQNGKPFKNNQIMSIACAKDALSRNESFKLAIVTIPLDSYLYEILVYSKDKELWLISIDVMLDKSDSSMSLKKCANIKFTEATFSGIGCKHMPIGDWVAEKMSP